MARGRPVEKIRPWTPGMESLPVKDRNALVEAVKWVMRQDVVIPESPRPDSFPAGAMVDYAGSTPPTGWLDCDGSSKATADYPDLFAAIGYTYGGAGANFNVPDCQRRATQGKGASDSLNDNDGAAYASRSPGGSHLHAVSITSQAGSASLMSHGSQNTQGPSATQEVQSGTGVSVASSAHLHQQNNPSLGHTPFGHPHLVQGSTGSTAGGDAPYLIVNKIIKT